MVEQARSVLVYRIGSLGDTLLALPALWTVRNWFAGARITLLCDRHPGSSYVLAPDLLAGSGIVDDFVLYPVDSTPLGRILRSFRMARVLHSLRRRRFDTLVYLAPSNRSPRQMKRDRLFFRAAGIRRFIGMHDVNADPPSAAARPLKMMPCEADLLLTRLKLSGLPIPQTPRCDLGLVRSDTEEVEAWIHGLAPDGKRPWISVGPGGKQPVNLWPSERYRRVVAELIERFDIWPVVFGGPEDKAAGDALVENWGRGYNAAGSLGLRATACALIRCRLHLGNDTGTMHLAASAGIPCVAVFSSHDPPGQWYPYGAGHRVLRTPIDCEGCRLFDCIERQMECILSVSVEKVLAACEEVLAASRVPVY